MFTFQSLHLSGAFRFTMPAFNDDRGAFVKVFQEPLFQKENIHFELRESYFSLSRKDVIRGMHFQLPPFQHSKIVFCPQGAILDVILDLRKDSSTYGSYFAAELSEDNHCGLFIPEGFAHGFKTLTENALTSYLVSSAYNKESDTGIRWDSFGMDWQLRDPIISSRDRSFIALPDFKPPF
jgi:dTDP-4-dehydrorhamnose 3,5-epimerase